MPDVAQKIAQIDVHGLDTHATRLDFRKVEHVVEDR